MDLKQRIESLSGIERKLLQALGSEEFSSVQGLSQKSGLPVDSVRRAIEWLKEKGLIEVSEEKQEALVLTPIGKSSLNKALPERLFIEALQQLNGKASIEQVYKQGQLNRPEMNVAMGIAKRRNWIIIKPGKDFVQAGVVGRSLEPMLELTGIEKELLDGNYPLEVILGKVSKKEDVFGEGKQALQEALKRGLVEKVQKGEKRARLSADGKKALQMLSGVKQRVYNIQGEVPKIMVGKKQAYAQFLENARQKLLALGFKEMQSPIITQQFYNFDALFQPQNHPARQWSDTYQLKQPSFGKLPGKEVVQRVRAAHENGWKTGSKGWGYKWNPEIASRVMPAGHGTAHSARQMVSGIEVPGKYFSIARCYRPDVVDASHLIEFNQLDGIIIDETLTFRSLLGILKEFAVEIADAKRVKFASGYFPFTEPSCELYIEHPRMGWIEVGGAGIFRPELTLPLGIKQPVIAWGLGIDRLAMIRLGVKDIRKLFSKDLRWLRKAPMARF